MDPAAPPIPAVEEPVDLRRAWLVLWVTSLASFQTAMALSIIFVVFPDLRSSYPDASAASLSWVVNIFTILGASTLVLGSAVSERLGRKRMLLIGVATFSAASVLAALAPGVGVLILARSLQAVGASLSLPAGATIVMSAFPPDKRGSAVASWSAVGAIAAALGPSLGGLLVDVGSWRWAFWLNLPIGAVAVTAGFIVLPSVPPARDVRMPDRLGSLGLFLGVGGIVLGLVESREWGWGDPRTILSMVVGALLLAGTLRRSARHPRPVLALDLFRTRAYTLGNLAMTLYAVGFFGYQFASVLFLTTVWGHSIRDAGLLSTPLFVATGIMSMVAGRIGERSGYAGLLAVGGLLWSGAALFIGIGLDGTRDVSTWLLVAVVAGLGSGLLWGALFAVVMSRLPTERLSTGASVNQTLQRIGNALGVAVMVTILGSSSAAGDPGTFPAVFCVSAGLTLVGTVIGIVGTRTLDAEQRAAEADREALSAPR